MTRKYNEGDWVTCIPGFHNGSSVEPNFGGRGYVEGYTFKIQGLKQPTKGILAFQIPQIFHRGLAYFPDDVSCGVYEIALRSATQEEIDNVLHNFTCKHEDAEKGNQRCEKECSTCAQHRFTLEEWSKENPPFGGPYEKPKRWTDDDMYECWKMVMGHMADSTFHEWLEKYKNIKTNNNGKTSPTRHTLH